ncbi:NAD+ synthase [Fusobacterium sp. PH5-44]|uniref:NAD+ synthase n=1 Tax=unclassified Fusobacterium TaxID=2648384 RepID=UPI003D1FFDB3
MKGLELDMEILEKILVEFVRTETLKSGFSKLVFGLSGGIDSALSAFIGAKALGKENVLGIMMPYKTSSKESVLHARLVIDALGIQSKLIEITPMVDAYFALESEVNPLRKGNKMARERMSILFDYSAKEKSLVLGTSNKTEMLLGYSTQFGDGASAINPLGDLYKTQIWQLSEYMGIPKKLIDKKPSADLWEGQTDEKELGFSYEMADKILFRLIDERKTKEEIIKEGFESIIVESVIKKVKMTQYKRKLPIIAKISGRTIGQEFRYPRDWEK